MTRTVKIILAALALVLLTTFCVRAQAAPGYQWGPKHHNTYDKGGALQFQAAVTITWFTNKAHTRITSAGVQCWKSGGYANFKWCKSSKSLMPASRVFIVVTWKYCVGFLIEPYCRFPRLEAYIYPDGRINGTWYS